MGQTPREIMERLRAASPDPIGELVDALKRHDSPAAAWVERWSAQGQEPVRAAWSASRNPEAMLALLAVARRVEDLAVAAQAAGVLEPGDQPFSGEDIVEQVDKAGWYAFFGFGEEVHHRAAAAIRAVVPTPPTLVEVVRGCGL